MRVDIFALFMIWGKRPWSFIINCDVRCNFFVDTCYYIERFSSYSQFNESFFFMNENWSCQVLFMHLLRWLSGCCCFLFSISVWWIPLNSICLWCLILLDVGYYLLKRCQRYCFYIHKDYWPIVFYEFGISEMLAS